MHLSLLHALWWRRGAEEDDEKHNLSSVHFSKTFCPSKNRGSKGNLHDKLLKSSTKTSSADAPTAENLHKVEQNSAKKSTTM